MSERKEENNADSHDPRGLRDSHRAARPSLALEPTTESGRRLLDGFAPLPLPDAPELHRRSAMGRRNKLIGGILDIEAEARTSLAELARAVLPEVMDAELGSIVTADMHDAVRIIEAKADRWAALRDALTELKGEA